MRVWSIRFASMRSSNGSIGHRAARRSTGRSAATTASTGVPVAQCGGTSALDQVEQGAAVAGGLVADVVDEAGVGRRCVAGRRAGVARQDPQRDREVLGAGCAASAAAIGVEDRTRQPVRHVDARPRRPPLRSVGR